jgi:Putative transposase
MRLLTRLGFLIEEQGMTYLAEADRESSLLPLQAASCTYRLALGRRAGQKVVSVQSLLSADKTSEPGLCAKLHGLTLHAAVRWGADQRQQLEHLCRYITRPAIANERRPLAVKLRLGHVRLTARGFGDIAPGKKKVV